MTVELSAMRREYDGHDGQKILEDIRSSDSYCQDPLRLLKEWINQAAENENEIEPNAFVLSTIDIQNETPDARVVLCKRIILSSDQQPIEQQPIEQQPIEQGANQEENNWESQHTAAIAARKAHYAATGRTATGAGVGAAIGGMIGVVLGLGIGAGLGAAAGGALGAFFRSPKPPPPPPPPPPSPPPIESGLCFFTNYDSQKGNQLSVGGKASATFWFRSMNRQVRVKGVCTKLSDAENDDYFNSRPFLSRLSAIASDQSRIIPTKTDLQEKVASLENQYNENQTELTRPPQWGGYILKPNSIEFWIGCRNRLHDRLRFILNENNQWMTEWLQP